MAKNQQDQQANNCKQNIAQKTIERATKNTYCNNVTVVCDVLFH